MLHFVAFVLIVVGVWGQAVFPGALPVARLQPRQGPGPTPTTRRPPPSRFTRIPNVTHEFIDPVFPSGFYCAIAITYRFDPALLLPLFNSTLQARPPVANTSSQLTYPAHTTCLLMGIEDGAKPAGSNPAQLQPVLQPL